MAPGGGGINVARGLHRLGLAAQAVLMAGGPPGELLQLLLAQKGPVQYAVPTAAWSRETPTVVDASSNQQCRLGMPYPSLLTTAIFRLCLTSRRRTSISG